METTFTSIAPFATGRDRPQCVELVDVNGDAVALVYGETKREARAMADHIANLLNGEDDKHSG